MTARAVVFLIIAAGIVLLAFVPGHWAGRRSRRHDYPDGWDAGQAAERQRWEQGTGATWLDLAEWNTARSRKPGAVDTDQWRAWLETGEPPSKEVLFRTAELDQMAAEYEAAQSRAPVVADITSAARWRPPGHAEVTIIDGRVVPPAPGHGDGWDRAAGLPDYAAAALGGHRTVDECVDSIVMRAVGR